MKRKNNALTLPELIISLGVFIIALMVTLPAVNLTKPPTVAIKYIAMYIRLQENALKAIANPDNQEHYSPYAFASITADEVCEHIAAEFKTKGRITCNDEGSSLSPNFYLSNKSSLWGFGGSDYTVPDFDISNQCSDPSSGYNCYKTIFVDINGNLGLNTLGTDIYRLRLRFDGKVDTLPSWEIENTHLESF